LGVGFEGVDPRALFIPSCQGVTGLTGALDWSDWCKPLVGFVLGNCFVHVVCPVVLLASSWLVWSCFAGFAKGSCSLQVVHWEWFLFQGLEESLRFPGTFVVRLL
jgi:hypothetical protein